MTEWRQFAALAEGIAIAMLAEIPIRMPFALFPMFAP
jgi:hypothetical protein